MAGSSACALAHAPPLILPSDLLRWFFFNLAEITDTEPDPHLSPPPPFKPYCLALCSHVMHHIVVV